ARSVICAAATAIELEPQTPLQLKLGIHSAPVVGGVVGLQAPRFALFGEAIDVAALLAQTSVPGHIQLSDATRQRLTPAAFHLRTRAAVALAGHGRIQTHFLSSRA
ncbi:MAG: adenylate/guanylate cyclase domain-containing protein, partial [Nannocystaceae bacterium]